MPTIPAIRRFQWHNLYSMTRGMVTEASYPAAPQHVRSLWEDRLDHE
jgi:hypothetical protein